MTTSSQLAARMRRFAAALDADPEANVGWRLYDEETVVTAAPFELDGEAGACVQMSKHHFMAMPFVIAMRLSAMLAHAALASQLKLDLAKETADE